MSVLYSVGRGHGLFNRVIYPSIQVGGRAVRRPPCISLPIVSVDTRQIRSLPIADCRRAHAPELFILELPGHGIKRQWWLSVSPLYAVLYTY